jgi:uncharacterized ferredoxin-like protein
LNDKHWPEITMVNSNRKKNLIVLKGLKKEGKSGNNQPKCGGCGKEEYEEENFQFICVFK